MRPPLSFFVAGLPKAQPRTKAYKHGNHAGVYDPGTADGWKMIVRNEAGKAWTMEETMGTAPMWEGPLCVSLTFYFPRPKAHYRSNGELRDTAPRWHTTKPDRDNLDKAVCDALTNLGIWLDDKQVCDGRIQKRYADGHAVGCQIEIKEADEI